MLLCLGLRIKSLGSVIMEIENLNFTNFKIFIKFSILFTNVEILRIFKHKICSVNWH